MSLTLIEEIKTKGSCDFDAIRKVHALEKKAEREYIKEIFKELKDTFLKHKIKFIIGEFSGGNDEGGFDDVYFANEKEEQILIDCTKDEFESRRDFRFFLDKKKYL